MAGLLSAIHVFVDASEKLDVDTPDIKREDALPPGHDVVASAV
jgi:hypothetical protein